MIETKEYGVKPEFLIWQECLAILMTVGFLVLLVYSIKEYLRKPDYESGKFVVASLSLALTFVITSAYVLANHKDRRPILSVDADGIELGGNILAAGRIPWSNIRSTRIQNVVINGVVKTKYLVIDLVDNEAALASLPWWKKQYLRSVISGYSSPAVIAPYEVPVPLDEIQLLLENALIDRRNQYRTYEAVPQERIALQSQAGR